MRYFVCGLAGYTMISWTVNIVTYTLYTTVWHWWTNYIIISVTIVSFGPKKSYGQIYFLLPESSLFICKCKYFMFYAFLHSIWTYFENRKTFQDFILQPIGKVFRTFLSYRWSNYIRSSLAQNSNSTSVIRRVLYEKWSNK